MKAVVGIDVGGSTTKIVGFDETGRLIDPIFVRANDQITSVYGALGRFTSQNGLELSDIDKIMVTGVGSTFIHSPIYGIPCQRLVEFPCIGRGGIYLSGLDEAVVVSMGTGTSLVYADKSGTCEYLGGTGVGGGTLVGLSEKLAGVRDIHHIIELAENGDLSRVDLRVSDITKQDVHPDLSPDLTASNFGKISDMATKSDLALGIINMVVETAAMLAVFAARAHNTQNVVVVGNMTTLPQARKIFDSLRSVFSLNFLIPDNANFGPVIGAALLGS